MCVETMDTTSKRMKTNCLRRTMLKPTSKLRWKLLRVSTDEDGAFGPCGASAVKGTSRKYLRREQKRAQLVKLAKALGDMGKKEKRESIYEEESNRHSPGAMAPENTTQYLMNNVYEDMSDNDIQSLPVSHETSSQLYGESLSPRSVYAALDSGYESCLAYQQRDFEEVFDLCW
ncbi:hypothetical protein PAMP_015062 [Pampus punctatissimus]